MRPLSEQLGPHVTGRDWRSFNPKDGLSLSPLVVTEETMSEQERLVVVGLNGRGKALIAVGPYETEDEALGFYMDTMGRAYPGFEIVSLMTADEYVRPHQDVPSGVGGERPS